MSNRISGNELSLWIVASWPSSCLLLAVGPNGVRVWLQSQKEWITLTVSRFAVGAEMDEMVERPPPPPPPVYVLD